MIHTKIPVGLISLLLLIVMACSLSPPAGPSGPTRTPASTSTPRPTETPLPPKPIVPYTPVPADALSPNVIWRSPQRGESLAPDGAIELTFDKPMDRDAVQSALRVQLAGAETALEGELSWLDERTARFKPAKALARAAAYDVILTQDATAASGEPLREPLSFRFSTAGYLEAAQVVPDAGATDVETDADDHRLLQSARGAAHLAPADGGATRSPDVFPRDLRRGRMAQHLDLRLPAR